LHQKVYTVYKKPVPKNNGTDVADAVYGVCCMHVVTQGFDPTVARLEFVAGKMFRRFSRMGHECVMGREEDSVVWTPSELSSPMGFLPLFLLDWNARFVMSSAFATAGRGVFLDVSIEPDDGAIWGCRLTHVCQSTVGAAVAILDVLRAQPRMGLHIDLTDLISRWEMSLDALPAHEAAVRRARLNARAREAALGHHPGAGADPPAGGHESASMGRARELAQFHRTMKTPGQPSILEDGLFSDADGGGNQQPQSME
jgi:hypothetical protein